MRLPIACLALVLSLAPARAGAVIYVVSFGGAIESIDPLLDDGTFQVGGEVSGSFQLDADVPDGEPLPEVVNFEAVLDLSVAFGSYLATGDLGEFFLRDAVPPGLDELLVGAAATGADVAGIPLFSITLDLRDSTAAAFSAAAVPTSLDLADFDNATVRLSFDEGTVVATVTSLSYLPVPEPGGVLLAGIGGLTLALLRSARAGDASISARARGSRARPRARGASARGR